MQRVENSRLKQILLLQEENVNLRKLLMQQEQWLWNMYIKHSNGVRFIAEQCQDQSLELKQMTDEISAASKRAIKRTDVIELSQEFEQDDCNFEDISGVVDIALRYTRIMPDSHVKCLLNVLAKHVQNYKASETACKVAG